MKTIVKRVAERLNCDIPIQVSVGVKKRRGRIVDLTPFGAQISMNIAFEPDDIVTVELRGDRTEGKVMWSDVGRMGVRFSKPVEDGPLRKHIESLNSSIYGSTMLPSMRRLEKDS